MSYNRGSCVFIVFSVLLRVVRCSDYPIALDSCEDSCGGVDIPYPFGTRDGCYMDKRYAIECRIVSGNFVPFHLLSSQEIVKISLPQAYGGSFTNATIMIKSPMNSRDQEALKYFFNITRMPTSKLFQATEYVLRDFQWNFLTKNQSYVASLGCHTSLGDDMEHSSTISCICDQKINSSCACAKGYKGNPYILNGCKDIDECTYTCRGEDMHCVNVKGTYHCKYKFSLKNLTLAGIFLIVVGPCLLGLVGLCVAYILIRKLMRIRCRNRFFKRNGGLLMQEQMSMTQGSVEVERTKLFSSKELAKATRNFSSDRVLGEGGQGRVYKGMLNDGRVVAIKKSTAVDEDKVKEFINEILVLTQVSHRHIVRLLGCCLETEVPLLVYEFIANGNLFEHIHNELADVTWDVRLRLAIEIAGALYYLHSAASIPIFHRDIKSSNIMLDDKLRAKVADFGTSRTVPDDHTHLTTMQVRGTAGYLDPEFYQSNQYTDRSDVYGFGVVLAELLTGEKPVCFARSPEDRTLVTYFCRAMKEKRLGKIIDARIKDESDMGQIMAVAHVARKCLNLRRRRRPDMRQVLTELETCLSSPEALQPHDGYDDSDDDEEEEEGGAAQVYIGIDPSNDVAATAPASSFNVAAPLWSDVEPLVPLTL